jgi:hypothetical protein
MSVYRYMLGVAALAAAPAWVFHSGMNSSNPYTQEAFEFVARASCINYQCVYTGTAFACASAEGFNCAFNGTSCTTIRCS